MISADLEAQIEKLVQRLLYEKDPQQRSTAANVLFQRFAGAGLHPNDIRIRLNGSQGQFPLLEQLRQKVNRQTREIDYLRAHVDPLILKGAVKAGNVEWRWPELKELIRSRITGDDPESGTLQPGWKARLSKLLGINSSSFVRWEEGIEQIPDVAFETLRSMEEIARVKPGIIEPNVNESSHKQRQSRSGNFPWTQETYCHVFKMKQEKASKKVIIKYLQIPEQKYGAVDRAFQNDGPDEHLLGREIIVRETGPMDYLEFWKIGYTIWSTEEPKRTDTWKGFIAKRFDKGGKSIQWDDPVWLSEEQRCELRQEYLERINKRHSELRGQKLLSLIRELWAVEISFAATAIFVKAHVQKEPTKLTHNAEHHLQERYRREAKYRSESKRYLHLSRGLALLVKRTKRQARSAEKSDMPGPIFRQYAVQFFGEMDDTKLQFYMAQLLGFDHTIFRDIYQERSRAVTNQQEQLVRTISSLIDGLNLDDPACEDELMKRVKSYEVGASMPHTSQPGNC